MDLNYDKIDSFGNNDGRKAERRVDASSCTASEEMRRDLVFEILYDVEISADLANHYRRLETGVSFLSIVLGITAASNFYGAVNSAVLGALGFIATVLGVASSVYGFGRKSYEFEAARVAFTRMLTKAKRACSVEDLASIAREVADLNVECCVRRVVEARAYNRALERLEHRDGMDGMYRIGFFKYHTRFLFDWRVDRF